jgi:hypothetical protein
LRVTFDGVGLTQFGVVALIEKFFQRIALQGSFSQHIRFPQRNNRYSISESLEAFLYPLLLGLGRIETTEPLRNYGVLHCLAGLLGYQESSSLRRFWERFARARRNASLNLHDRWRAAMLGHPAQVIFDLDSTVLTVYGRQKGSGVGYDPRRAADPLIFLWSASGRDTRDCWEGTYHPGDTRVLTVKIPLLARTRDHAEPKVKGVLSSAGSPPSEDRVIQSGLTRQC